jgi:hypothetical protein
MEEIWKHVAVDNEDAAETSSFTSGKSSDYPADRRC